MANFANLQQTINWAKTFVQYVPINAGFGLEPAVSIASMIRTSMLNPPLTWHFNRNQTTFNTVVGTQDYTVAISDFGFVEKVSLTDDAGNIIEIKDIYNNAALSLSSFQQRPNAMSVESSDSAGNFTFRFLGVPNKIYTVTLVYQKLAPQFGPFFISSVANASGGNTAYTGTFDVISFPAASIATITGYTGGSLANNGAFAVVSCTATVLTVANASGVVSTQQGFANNLSWGPIPDTYADVYNNLFLSETLAMVDDARAQVYRQRGVAALMSKASGLTEMQKNAFAQQWLARNNERQASSGMIQLGNTGRGI